MMCIFLGAQRNSDNTFYQDSQDINNKGVENEKEDNSVTYEELKGRFMQLQAELNQVGKV